jgi:hypothetical protein
MIRLLFGPVLLLLALSAALSFSGARADPTGQWYYQSHYQGDLICSSQMCDNYSPGSPTNCCKEEHYPENPEP